MRLRTRHTDLPRVAHSHRADHGHLREDQTSTRDRRCAMCLTSQQTSMAVRGQARHLHNMDLPRGHSRQRRCLPVGDRSPKRSQVTSRKWSLCPSMTTVTMFSVRLQKTTIPLGRLCAHMIALCRRRRSRMTCMTRRTTNCTAQHQRGSKSGEERDKHRWRRRKCA